ncbi:MAG: helix-turn-helix transcriptional regulator [Kiritimatiellae bacterium]|nr:helix-turn-helix transcriptional regulator [Kiritimatiellia bacterium]
MANLASVLKDEVARLARKEIRSQTATLQKASAQYRRDVAALKRRAAALERQVALLERNAHAQAAPAESAPAESTKLRFTAKGLRTQRKRLGLSAGAYAKLVGVTAQSIYNWERGTAKPRQSQIAAIAALRGIGKKEAKAKLAQLPAAPAKRAAAKKVAAKKTAPRKAKKVKKVAAKKTAPRKAKKAVSKKRPAAKKRAVTKRKK